MPAGFRFPASADYSGDWAAFRAQIPVPFHVTADLNGDGRADEAWLLLADPAPAWALVVFLASPTGTHRVIQLQAESKEDVHRYGIMRADPGRYETACGKGFWTCEADEPAVLSLKLPALQFFLFESASCDLLVGPCGRPVPAHLDQRLRIDAGVTRRDLVGTHTWR